MAGDRDKIDLDFRSPRERGDADGRAGGRIFSKVAAVDFVHGLEIVHVGEENGRFDDMTEAEMLGAENCTEVFQHAPGLRGHVVADQLSALRIERDLAGGKEHAAATHRLRIGTDRGRRFIGGDNRFHRRMLCQRVRGSTVIPRARWSGAGLEL